MNMNKLTVSEIESLVCFFQDYLNGFFNSAYLDNNENNNLDTAIAKLENELR